MSVVHVVGAGGIGCAVGYALRAAGVPVVFVDANPAKVEAGRRDGVRVGDRPALPAEFVPFAEWSPPPAAAAGIDNGKLLSVPAARHLFFALLQENYRILTAAGVELGKVGPFHPRTVAWILRRRWLAGLMARAFEPSLRGTYCSMAGEIQKGRTELDNYNGHLIRLADKTGTTCPLNRAVYDLVTKMTAAMETPRQEGLKE